MRRTLSTMGIRSRLSDKATVRSNALSRGWWAIEITPVVSLIRIVR